MAPFQEEYSRTYVKTEAFCPHVRRLAQLSIISPMLPIPKQLSKPMKGGEESVMENMVPKETKIGQAGWEQPSYEVLPRALFTALPSEDRLSFAAASRR